MVGNYRMTSGGGVSQSNRAVDSSELTVEMEVEGELVHGALVHGPDSAHSTLCKLAGSCGLRPSSAGVVKAPIHQPSTRAKLWGSNIRTPIGLDFRIEVKFDHMLQCRLCGDQGCP